MKTIEIDDELYQYIASQTREIGETASSILRRLLIDAPDVQITKQITTTNTSLTQTTKSKLSLQPVMDLVSQSNVQRLNSANKKFLLVLAKLHQIHQGQFYKVLSIKGRERNYFAEEKEQLLKVGSTVKPMLLDDSHYWVVTNNNIQRKKLIIKKVALTLGYDEHQAETLQCLIERK